MIHKNEYLDYYFLTAPEKLLLNHYPDQIRWSQVDNPFSKSEFEHFPLFLSKDTSIKSISFMPQNGTVSGHKGEIVIFEITQKPVKSPAKDAWYTVVEIDSANNPISDTTDPDEYTRSKMVSCKCLPDGRLHFEYKVCSKSVKGLYLFDGKEYLLAYRLKVEED